MTALKLPCLGLINGLKAATLSQLLQFFFKVRSETSVDFARLWYGKTKVLNSSTSFYSQMKSSTSDIKYINLMNLNFICEIRINIFFFYCLITTLL